MSDYSLHGFLKLYHSFGSRRTPQHLPGPESSMTYPQTNRQHNPLEVRCFRHIEPNVRQAYETGDLFDVPSTGSYDIR